MKRVHSARFWLRPACAIGFAVAFAAACSGSTEGEDESEDCIVACEQQNDLCPDRQDCSALCGAIADITATTGCGAEYQESVDCLTRQKQCDSAMTLCPGTSYKGCLRAYCATHPEELFCP